MEAQSLEKTGSSEICSDGRENHGSSHGKLLHKGAIYANCFTLDAERIQAHCFAAPPGLAKSRQRIDGHGAHPSKSRKNQKRQIGIITEVFCSTHFIVDKVLHFIVYRLQ